MMPIEYRQVSPLGVCYRSPLGVFTQAEEAPGPVDGQLDTTSPFISTSLVHRVTTACSGGNVNPAGALTPGMVSQELLIPPALQSRPVADWYNATYSGSGITYTPSAISASLCIQSPIPPFQNVYNHRYAGPNSIEIDPSTFAYDVVFMVIENDAQTTRTSVVFYWNDQQWPGSYNGHWPHPTQVDVTFN